MTSPQPQTPSVSPLTASNLKHNPASFRTLFGMIMTGLCWLAAGLALLPLLAVLFYVVYQGASQLNIDVFFDLTPPRGNGFGNAIQGTLVMVGIGAIISVPVGIMAAVFLSEFGVETKLADWIRFATNVLSGVPSIIVGVFAYGAVVLTINRGFTAIAGGFALSILMLPIIVRATEESLKLVPQEVRQASVGLGATNYHTVFRVVLPAALPAIVTGVTLAIARAAGETAPLLFTALSSQYYLRFSEENLDALFEPAASLAVFVYDAARFQNYISLGWAASLILVLLVLVTSVVSRLATARKIY